jgi:hypothetical protein
VQFQILDAFTIDPQPLVDVGVLRPLIAFLNFAQPILVDPGKHWPKRQSENGALCASPGAPVTFSTQQFAEFS